MATFPGYVTELGKSIASKARNLVRANSAKVPSTNGYLVHTSRVKGVESGLLSYKGIEESDRESHDEDIIEEAEELIQKRMALRKGIAQERNLPVTFNAYCRYVSDNFDMLIDEILQEYGDDQDKIIDHLPRRDRLSRARFKWYHYSEVPSLMMYGENSLRDILHQQEQNQDRVQKTQAAIRSEILSFQELCREAVGSVQYRVRSEIAEKLRDFVSKVSTTKTYSRDGEDVVLPRNITDNALSKLQSRIDELTCEIEEVADNDEFYETVRNFRDRLTSGLNMEDGLTRRQISEDATRIIEHALDDDAIDANTGRFYASILL